MHAPYALFVFTSLLGTYRWGFVNTSNATCHICHARIKGAYKSSPVFIQGVGGRNQTFPAGQCIPCRYDLCATSVSSVDCCNLPQAVTVWRYTGGEITSTHAHAD